MNHMHLPHRGLWEQCRTIQCCAVEVRVEKEQLEQKVKELECLVYWEVCLMVCSNACRCELSRVVIQGGEGSEVDHALLQTQISIASSPTTQPSPSQTRFHTPPMDARHDKHTDNLPDPQDHDIFMAIQQMPHVLRDKVESHVLQCFSKFLNKKMGWPAEYSGVKFFPVLDRLMQWSGQTLVTVPSKACAVLLMEAFANKPLKSSSSGATMKIILKMRVDWTPTSTNLASATAPSHRVAKVSCSTRSAAFRNSTDARYDAGRTRQIS